MKEEELLVSARRPLTHLHLDCCRLKYFKNVYICSPKEGLSDLILSLTLNNGLKIYPIQLYSIGNFESKVRDLIVLLAVQ